MNINVVMRELWLYKHYRDQGLQPLAERALNHAVDALGQLETEPNVLNAYAASIHSANATWWLNPVTSEPIERNKGELLMLIVSELAEAMEGIRKNLMDDHLPHRSMEEVELADALIRIMDYAGGYRLDLDGAVTEKLAYNAQRADHKPENRVLPGGKTF